MPVITGMPGINAWANILTTGKMASRFAFELRISERLCKPEVKTSSIDEKIKKQLRQIVTIDLEGIHKSS